MKKLNRLFYAACVASVLVLSGCGDDKNEDPKPAPIVKEPTKKEILTAKTWKTSALIYDGIDKTNDPGYEIAKSMQYKFNADGTYARTFLNGASTGTWAFQMDETYFFFDPNTPREEGYQIIQLNDNSLQIKGNQYNGTPTPTTFEWRFVHAN